MQILAVQQGQDATCEEGAGGARGKDLRESEEGVFFCVCMCFLFVRCDVTAEWFRVSERVAEHSWGVEEMSLSGMVRRA